MNANYGFIVGSQYLPTYIEYTTSSADQQVQWSILDTNSSHNQVLDVTFTDNNRQGQITLGHPDSNSATQDLSQFQTGSLEFDLRVVNQGAAFNAMSGGVVLAVRTDCLWPCAAHETLVTVTTLNTWEHVSLSVIDLIASGLDISKINNSLVIVPQGQQANLHFQLDNVQLTQGQPAVAQPSVIFKEDFNNSNISNWQFSNFVGTAMTGAFANFGAAVTLSWNATNDTLRYETALNNTIDITNRKASFQIKCWKNTFTNFSYQMIATDVNGGTATTQSKYGMSLVLDQWDEISEDLGNNFPNGFDATQVSKIGWQFVYLGTTPNVTQCNVDTVRITQ